MRSGLLALALAAATAAASPSAEAAKPAKAAEPAKAAKADPAYVDELVARARRLGLAQDEMWRRLVHYRPGTFSGWTSEADAKSFFVSPDGKDDPEAELEATLRGFFGPEPEDERLEHPYCRFPARLAWLNSKLGFDFTRVPRRSCPRFQDYHQKLQPRSLVLVFSSYYLNNPASAFGHTFLRVNKLRRGDEEDGLELLDYGIDYSANVDTNNSLVYAFKGLTGMFPGVFRKIPYYLKVREYNDYESRDLWEYELNLTPEQVSMVVAHLWELGSNYFEYYYLSENCSYHVLGALEVANPKLQLLDKLGWPVLPSDTVKAVKAEPGLVRKVRYRPSNRTQFLARLSRLSATERDLVAGLVDDPDAAFPAELDRASQARVLDTALDLVDFRYARDLVRDPGEEADPEGVAVKQKLLERRAAMQLESEDLVIAPPFRKMPHLGHDSSRLGLGSGHLEGRGYFHTLDLRLALHDLADPAQGYPEEAAIEFLPLRLRYYVEDPTLSLEDLSLIRVTSLAPMDRFVRKWSWTVRAGATRVRDGGCDACFAPIGEFGAGLSLAPLGEGSLLWALADARILWPVDGGLLGALRAGIGPAGGLRVRLGDDFALLGSGSWHYLPAQDPWSTWEIDAVARWQYTRDFALGLEGRAQPDAIAGQAFSFIYF